MAPQSHEPRNEEHFPTGLLAGKSSSTVSDQTTMQERGDNSHSLVESMKERVFLNPKPK